MKLLFLVIIIKMDLTFFNENLDTYYSKKEIEEIEEEENIDCLHKDIIMNNNINVCFHCGKQITKNLNCDKEWIKYSSFDGRHNSNPDRVQLRKTDDRNIFKDVEHLGFNSKIIFTANDIFQEVTGGKIKRGKSRKSVIFACIFQAYKLNNNPQTHESLSKMFEINKKTGLQGIKLVILNISKQSKIHTTHITPVHLINEIMENFKVEEWQKNEVIELYNKIKNKNSKLNRVRPKSIAASLTYYWIVLNNKNISRKQFTKITGISEITVSKYSKIIEEILKK